MARRTGVAVNSQDALPWKASYPRMRATLEGELRLKYRLPECVHTRRIVQVGAEGHEHHGRVSRVAECVYDARRNRQAPDLSDGNLDVADAAVLFQSDQARPHHTGGFRGGEMQVVAPHTRSAASVRRAHSFALRVRRRSAVRTTRRACRGAFSQAVSVPQAGFGVFMPRIVTIAEGGVCRAVGPRGARPPRTTCPTDRVPRHRFCSGAVTVNVAAAAAAFAPAGPVVSEAAATVSV